MTSAGYSATPLPTKLGIKDGAAVAFLNAPEDFAETLGALPDGVTVRDRLRGPLDVIVFFTVRRAELERRIEPLQAALDPAARLWIAWPKRASKVETDMTEDVVRDVVLPLDLVDNKVCAVDEVWSGLRVVVRRDRGAARLRQRPEASSRCARPSARRFLTVGVDLSSPRMIPARSPGRPHLAFGANATTGCGFLKLPNDIPAHDMFERVFSCIKP